ncbi:MAG TPA: lysophospholipid acyltransferase family protein [Bacteroidales bacterium]|nr:lysophospholipid acyltransferase family protein [Bacteroidales bacterium]
MASILYFPLFGLAWLISLIPFRVLYLFSDLLYLIMYYIFPYRKKVVFHNLRTSFPEKSDEEITRIAKAFYRHFSDFLVEIIKVISLPQKRLDKRVVWKNTELFEELAAKKKSIALVSPHYGNWEMQNNVPDKMPHHRCMIIYRPLKSKLTGRISAYTREKFGAIMIPMENIFREAMKTKAEGKLFSIWFLADQRPPRNSRFWTIFLNHETAFFEGVEKMSRKLELAVVFMNIIKTGRGRYEVHLEKLFDNAAATAENEVTLTCVSKIEEMIKKAPEYWLWSHKRFKHSRPEGTNLVAR